MPGLVAEAEVPKENTEPQYSVTHQDIELEVEFRSRKLIGSATITIQPLSKDLRTIPLNCRGIDVKSLTVEGHPVEIPRSRDPYEAYRVREVYTVQQHEQLRRNIEHEHKDPPEPTFIVTLPKNVRIKEFNPNELSGTNTAKVDSAIDAAMTASFEDGDLVYTPLTLVVRYVVEKSREAVRWVGMQPGDSRYPHMYTCASSVPGLLPCFAFPIVGQASSRCSWRLRIDCPRTIGDFLRPKPVGAVNGINVLSNGVDDAMDVDEDEPAAFAHLTDEEKDLELQVVGSGLMEDSDAPHTGDHTIRRWIFHCSAPVGAHHVGFTIGPFEQVDFAQFRETGKEDQLKEQAVSVHGFCLPGREEELRNTGIPLQMAIDHFQQSYTAYPFAPDCQSYKLVFVDDLSPNVLDTATLSICSSRLLYPENVIDPAYENSRELIRAAASQWIGVFVSAQQAKDYWIIVGASYFMADIFMSILWGRNEVRYRQKLAADKIVQQDVGRPAIYDCGSLLGLDQGELEFLTLKAPVVFYIFHQRLMKQNASTGAPRVLVRLLSDARMGRIPHGEIWTDRLIYTSDKVAHQKLQSFFDQWVFGAGCPTFHVTHKFNKKKMSVEVTINQTQSHDLLGDKSAGLNADNFMREVKEHENGVWAGELQPAFTGPITVRVQEADGRPYEHIVEIREQTVKVEFNYNTKYKRLKRTKRAKERAAAATENRNDDEDGPEDAPVTYALGDVLQGDQELEDWRLTDWSQEDLATMQEEAYEWIRLDKDFEWICTVVYAPSPNYMFVQQLQQDNDVVAQIEALQWLSRQPPSALHSSIFTRTLMDPRYFHGVRTLAASALASCATDQAGMIGMFHLQKAFQDLFCFENSPMTRSNDFSDHRLYWLQCTIPQAMAGIRDADGKSPPEIKRFFLDKLKFNDNSNNQYSDSKYVAILMAGLAETLVENRVHRGVNINFSFGDDDEMEDIQAETDAAVFKKAALNEIDRLRRIDEWIPSHRNVYTLASLRSLTRLIENKVVPFKLAHFLRYTRAGNQDDVRLMAFECLVTLGALRKDHFLRYIIHSFASEPSQLVRERLWRIIGKGLAYIALQLTKGQEKKETAVDHLMIVDDAPTPIGQIPVDTPDGAVASLKKEMSDNEGLQDAIIEALRSPLLSMRDFTELLDLCSRLYKASESLLVSLKMPKYWNVQHEGEGKMRFFQINKFRFKPAPKIELKKPEKRRSSDASGDSPQAKRQKVSFVVKQNNKPKASSPSPFAATRPFSPVVAPAVAPAAPTPLTVIVPPQAQLPSPTLSQPPSFTQPAATPQPPKLKKPSASVSKIVAGSKISTGLKISTGPKLLSTPKSSSNSKPSSVSKGSSFSNKNSSSHLKSSQASSRPKRSLVVKLKLPTRKDQLRRIASQTPRPSPKPPRAAGTPSVNAVHPFKHTASASNSARSSPAPVVKPPTPANSAASPPPPPPSTTNSILNPAAPAVVGDVPPKPKFKLKLKMGGGGGPSASGGG
ncbi:hypothetical protein EG328_008498 [Venturia inaequalis]|uniref:Transcription initiation factor TFIID subunit 2 n=1 Tax=Venturia inaequalis TaxID=5025 RepID=A0A8H3YRM2_VENIN|nr:hypothetical protein EG328_008498 [Venturia inaequalis]